MAASAQDPAPDGEEADLLTLAAELRSHGSILPEDLGRVGDALATGSGLVQQVLRLALRLLGTVLKSVRVLVGIALVLAVVDTALFLVPRADQELFWFGAALVFAVALLPALALNRVGKRFAAFREAVGTIATGLPRVLSVPDSLRDEAAAIGALVEATGGQRFARRLVGRARVLLRVKKLITNVLDEHRDLIDATTTAVTYGPQDVVLATYGVIGIGVLVVCLPAFALAAILV